VRPAEGSHGVVLDAEFVRRPLSVVAVQGVAVFVPDHGHLNAPGGDVGLQGGVLGFGEVRQQLISHPVRLPGRSPRH
jgi:hypothetical protein